ncbi:MAG: type II toxin-antitoxin system HicB family antitoxin [Gemmatimonadetes bacterium]|nr:type II toxin-antitoxin system HicB family antitoxin [Gemmatimonadota bacterium]
MDYLLVVQRTENGYRAQVPDLDGCVTSARTREQVERQMRAVVEFHVLGLHHEGRDIPAPNAYATRVELGPAVFEVAERASVGAGRGRPVPSRHGSPWIGPADDPP